MAATRITIALNANQSQRAPLLIPSSTHPNPTSPTSIRALVLKTSQSKLRLKKPSRIYVAGTGYELVSEEDWKENGRNGIVLLVSAGEEYVGARREVGSKVHTNPDVPIEILANKAALDPTSISQLNTTASTLPGIVHAVGQPDLHPGNKFPIGAVIVSKGWIHPPLIGGDIGCGMAWYKTRLSRAQVDGVKGKKIAEKLRGLEGSWRTQGDRRAWLHDDGGDCSAGEEWDKALGTIGAGNHFAELQVVEESSAENHGLSQDDVVLLVHSGSRGYGGSILKKFTSESTTSFKEDDPQAVEYIREHDKACKWATANRDLIALRFLACLEPGNEAWGSSNATGEADVGAIEQARKMVRERKLVDIWHNNVERVKWPPSPPLPSDRDDATMSTLVDASSKLTLDEEVPSQDYVWIHRKGAAPTYNPTTQQPLSILPLPGSRGTPTLILKPTFSASTSWGLKNALSLAHGAGRAMSRAKALSSLSSKYKGQNILEPRSGDGNGTWIICDEKDLVWEEAPDAYKDVEAVGQDLVDAGVAEIVGRCRARVSYKVRNEMC